VFLKTSEYAGAAIVNLGSAQE